MRILFLGPASSPVLAHLRSLGGEVRQTEDQFEDVAYDFVVSHGYQRIIPSAMCKALDGRAINLHISYLPWNRGSCPNLWSHLENTPKGVTIHYIAPGIDTGDIIAQQAISFGSDDTLATSYAKLQEALLHLFVLFWPAIAAGTSARAPQRHSGSYHRDADTAAVMTRLPLGWDTPIADLQRVGELLV